MRVRVWVPFIVGILLCALCVNLGFWQLRRYDEKQALQARFDAARVVLPVISSEALQAWQRVVLRGKWLPEGTVFIDNRSYRGQAGYYVLTPLLLTDNGGAVMVQRGWVATGPDRQRLPQPATSPGLVEVSGLVLDPVRGGFSLGESAAQPRVWQRIDPLRFKDQVPGAVSALIVQQESAAQDGLVRDWPRPDFGVEKHMGYALQWFSFATVLSGLMLWFGLRGRFRSAREAGPKV